MLSLLKLQNQFMGQNFYPNNWYFGTRFFVDQLNKLGLSSINMGHGINVSFVEVKSLGVILDSKLSWEPHIISVGKRSRRYFTL